MSIHARAARLRVPALLVVLSAVAPTFSGTRAVSSEASSDWDHPGQLEILRNAAMRIESISFPYGQRIGYGYDGTGRLSTKTYSGFEDPELNGAYDLDVDRETDELAVRRKDTGRILTVDRIDRLYRAITNDLSGKADRN